MSHFSAHQTVTGCLMPCSCKMTGHEPGCWMSLSGCYVNGAKVAPLHYYSPNVVQLSAPYKISWPET